MDAALMAARPASTISRKHKSGDQVDLLALIRMQNALARALWGLGLGRRKRTTLTPEDALDYAERFKSGGVK